MFWKNLINWVFDLFNKSILSIDIGFKNIKVVEVSVKKGNDVYLKNYGIALTPKGCIKNGVIQDISKLSYAIENIIKANNMKAKKTKIVMSGTCIISRVFIVEKVEGQDNNIIIENAIRELIPINAENYVVDYKLLEEFLDVNTVKLKFFVTAVRRNIIESYIKVLEECRLIPVSVDIPANSISKFFDRDIQVDINKTKVNMGKFKGLTKKSFAVIDFGSETTIVNILSERVLGFNRVILAGSTNIDNAIAEVLGKEALECERLKKLHGIIKPVSVNAIEEEHVVYDAVKETVDKLIKQISMCFNFYQYRCYGSPIERIYIIGGGSLLKGLDDYLEESLLIPVFPVSLMSIENICLGHELDEDNLNYLINSVGVTLEYL